MKSLSLIFICLCFTLLIQAQVSKTINVSSGGLYSALTVTEKQTINNLTVIGKIDASDFKTMRDNMLKLDTIDLSGTNIEAYTGQLGTYSNNGSDWTYPANTIPEASFNKGKPNILSFIFPSNVISIGDGAFSGCLFKSITIPSSVTFISGASFAGCTGLTTIEIPSGVTTLENSVFSGCTGLTSFVIPSQITSIGNKAFSDCTGLTSITIPSTVTYIGTQAFSNCFKLTSINVYHITPLALGSGIMDNSSAIFNLVNKNTCILYVPNGSLNAYRTAIQWKDFMNIVEFLSTDIEINKTPEFCIYPNPATDGFYLNGINKTSNLSLSDINGKLLISKEINAREYISLNSLPKGIYIVKILSEGNTFVKRIVKI